MISEYYYICDDFLYSLSKLGLAEKKTVYKATALNAWWKDEYSGKNFITRFVHTLYRLDELNNKRDHRKTLMKLREFWGVM